MIAQRRQLLLGMAALTGRALAADNQLVIHADQGKETINRNLYGPYVRDSSQARNDKVMP